MANDSQLQPLAELRTQFNVVKSNSRFRPWPAAIPQLTSDHSVCLGVDFTEGRKPEYPEKNPQSTKEISILVRGRDQELA